jgi:thiamine biosynthesis lipoprotein
MRCVDAALTASLLLAGDGDPIHQRRYAMGTMFDIVAYHEAREEAERAVTRALDEVERLDRVLSHYKPESDLSRLNREARGGFVTVDRDLYEVVRQSLEVSRRTEGRFDITVAPLVRVWKEASAEGHRPPRDAVAAVRRCIGFGNVDLEPPNRIRFRSDCTEIELGGIGKGYAVDRALDVLRSAGIRHAVVNGGGSSIAAIGTPPGTQREGQGWPVRLGDGTDELRLRDGFLSTSQQDGAIVDPATAMPASSMTAVTVTAASATLADALSTALVIMSRAEGERLLARFPGAAVTYGADAR